MEPKAKGVRRSACIPCFPRSVRLQCTQVNRVVATVAVVCLAATWGLAVVVSVWFALLLASCGLYKKWFPMFARAYLCLMLCLYGCVEAHARDSLPSGCL